MSLIPEVSSLQRIGIEKSHCVRSRDILDLGGWNRRVLMIVLVRS